MRIWRNEELYVVLQKKYILDRPGMVEVEEVNSRTKICTKSSILRHNFVVQTTASGVQTVWEVLTDDQMILCTPPYFIHLPASLGPCTSEATRVRR